MHDIVSHLHMHDIFQCSCSYAALSKKALRKINISFQSCLCSFWTTMNLMCPVNIL